MKAKKLVNEPGLNEQIKSINKRRNKKINNKSRIKSRARKKNLQTYELSLFIYQSYFVSDGAQLYLKLIWLYYTLKRLGVTEKVISWKSNGLPTEKFTNTTKAVNSVSPSTKWYKIQIFV